MGYGSILYLAAITGVDQSLYESATLDGAGRFKKWIYVTIPSIMPIVVIQLVMSMNGILSAGFDNILLLQNSQVMERAEVLDTYIYKVGLQDGRYSYSTAVGLFHIGNQNQSCASDKLCVKACNRVRIIGKGGSRR